MALTKKNAEFRLEHDFIGEKQVPAGAYYGVQSLRGNENFPITGERAQPSLIRAIAMVKKASAIANCEVGLLDEKLHKAIVAAADEIIAGKHADQFIVDPIQGGAGTSFNMNANEVIANRALEIMGVNSASYLILPKIVAAVLFFPLLTVLSILVGIAGGYMITVFTGIMIPDDFLQGLTMDFKPYSLVYTLIKMAVFAFIISSVSAYFGYYAKGNSLEVGAASTRAVVSCSIVIMIFNLILTQVLLI